MIESVFCGGLRGAKMSALDSEPLRRCTQLRGGHGLIGLYLARTCARLGQLAEVDLRLVPRRCHSLPQFLTNGRARRAL